MRNNGLLRSKYPYQSTTIYNITASLTENFETLTIFERVEKARSFIFPFDYPTPENVEHADFKHFFETMFISKYINDYFKYETFEAFELALYSKMLEVMPTYNIILSGIFEADADKLLLNVSETITDANGKQDTDNQSENKTVNKSNTTGNQKNITAKFPANLKTAGTKINDVKYADNGGITETSDNTSGNVDVTGKNVNKATSENHSKTTTKGGNRLDAYIKMNEQLKHIFNDLMLEFKPLFSMIINY